jgi:hypothetical protein
MRFRRIVVFVGPVVLALGPYTLGGCPGGDPSFPENEPCPLYCGSFPEKELEASCLEAIGSTAVLRQCAAPLAPEGCQPIATIAPATCPDGSADPVFCCLK